MKSAPEQEALQWRGGVLGRISELYLSDVNTVLGRCSCATAILIVVILWTGCTRTSPEPALKGLTKVVIIIAALLFALGVVAMVLSPRTQSSPSVTHIGPIKGLQSLMQGDRENNVILLLDPPDDDDLASFWIPQAEAGSYEELLRKICSSLPPCVKCELSTNVTFRRVGQLERYEEANGGSYTRCSS